ncbi:MAG TPA: BamA/TamA family outer membrane protein [Gemmatimonadaceae bacterium]
MTVHARGARLLVRALSLAAPLVVAAAAAAQKNGEPEEHPLVRSVALRGVSKVDQRLLAEGLATKSSKCKNLLYAPICLITRSPIFSDRRYLDVAELRRDELRIRLFYWRRGYRDIAVSSNVSTARGGVRVAFNIKENEPTIIEKLSVEQKDSVLPSTVVSRAVQLKEKDPLDLVAMDSSIYLLHAALWDRGYADAIVELDTSKVDNARNAGPVTLVLEPGPRTIVRAIDIDGNKEVTDVTVRRLLRLQPGGLYRRSALLESQRDLYLSGLFSEVEVAAQPSGDSAKTVEVRLTEAPLRNIDLTAGFTTADFLQFESLFTRYNFMGGARRLTLRGTVSNLLANQLNGNGVFYDVTNGALPAERAPFLRPTWSASVELNQPWFLTAGNQLTATVFTHRRSVPGVVTDVGGGATMSMTRDLGSRTNTTLGYTYEASRIEASDVYFCVVAGVCVPSTVRVLARRHPLSPVAFVTRYDGTNSPFTPTQGMRGRVELEYASRFTASDYQYARASATASKYFRTSRNSVLAARVRLGFVRALPGTNGTLGVPGDTASLVLHPRKQFFAGGSQSVRGYGENQLGPRVLTIDPNKLTDTSRSTSCTVSQLVDGSCDPNQPGVGARDFQPRPLGGTSLAEASVEYRFPITFARGLTGAVFLDGAVVGTRRFSDLFGATGAITPGFGVRFTTPIGPVRLDLGVRPRTVDDLPVITQVSDSSGNLQLVTLKTRRRFDESETSGRSLRKVLNRLTLHLAIGPAF